MPAVKPKVLAPGMYAIDVEPIPPHNRNNRKVHLDYLKHLKKSVETLREIVEEARIEKPLDNALENACFYTKRSQELLEYVIGTCPKEFSKRDKKVATAPLNRNKQVAFKETSETLNNNTKTHVKQQKVHKTNILVIPFTRVNSSTEASGSKPRSNTKNNRILPAKSDNNKKVKDHPRNNKSTLKQKNRVDSSISSKHTIINLNSNSVCKTCNKCLIYANHDKCVVNYLKSPPIPPPFFVVENEPLIEKETESKIALELLSGQVDISPSFQKYLLNNDPVFHILLGWANFNFTARFCFVVDFECNYRVPIDTWEAFLRIRTVVLFDVHGERASDMELDKENLIPIPRESKIGKDCDFPLCDDFQSFKTFSNPLFEKEDDFPSRNDESILKEEVHKETLKSYLNPLFEDDEEIISIEAFRQISPKVDVKTIVSFFAQIGNCVRKWATSEFVKDNDEINHEVFKSDNENDLGVHDNEEEEIVFLDGLLEDENFFEINDKKVEFLERKTKEDSETKVEPEKKKELQVFHPDIEILNHFETTSYVGSDYVFYEDFSLVVRGKDKKDKKKQKQSKTDKKREKTKTRVKNERNQSRISPIQQGRKSKAKIIKPRTNNDKCSKFKGLF
ncbi:hypothetical protein Tco_0139935 [Tanacetum coccineum]